MRTIETPDDALADILDILERGPKSAGNIARKLMGAGGLPNKPESYGLVVAALESLRSRGLAVRHGNGKSHQWRRVTKENQTKTESP